MNSLFIKDYERFTTHRYHFYPCFIRMIRNHELGFVFWGRQYETGKKIIRAIALPILHHYRRKYGIEIAFRKGLVGGGIRLVHPWDITVNDNAIIGENVTLYKGSTIGELLTGKKKGNPTIGNNVILYANSTVCGKISIGDNVEISAGAFVNFDVPSDSIVIGNPGVIHPRK